MDIIIKVYIYNVHTYETIESNQTIEKSSSGKSSFKSSICFMILYGPFSCNLILAVPLTVKYFYFGSTVFWFHSTILHNEETGCH